MEKLRLPMPEMFSQIFVAYETDDDYGHYSTGLFSYKGKNVFVNIEEGLWHLSVSADHTLGYYELKEIRYEFLPNGIRAAQIFPPREEFVNLHENCFHLYETSEKAYEDVLQNVIALAKGTDRAKNVLQASIDNPKNADKDMDFFKGKCKAYQEVHNIIVESFGIQEKEDK